MNIIDRNVSDRTWEQGDQAQLLATIDRWLERDVRPVVKEHDHADRWPEEIVAQMRAFGLFGATVGVEYGGLGLPATLYAEIVMRISAVWMAITGIFNSHLMLALAIEKFGTAAQKQQWLPKLASGEIRGGLALTEPDAGTDLQGIRMTARRDGDHYVINGTKTWISNGIEGSCFALLVKTDPQAEPRHKGMSLFVAPKQQGFRVGRKLEKLGYKSIDSAELIFEDYRVPADHLIGETRARASTRRPAGSSSGASMWRRAASASRKARCSSRPNTRKVRRTFGKPIAEHQAIALKLGEMATRAARRAAADARCRRRRSTAASAATWRPAWRSISPPRPRWRTRPSRCASTAPTATPRNTTSSGSTATRRSPASARAPTRCSA
jgi:alkylation response protein AidB-like acyl-CoA dehydrogenase